MRNIACFTHPCEEFPHGEFVYKIEVSKVLFRTISTVLSKRVTKHLDLVSIITPDKYVYDFILDEDSKHIQVGDAVIVLLDIVPKIVEVITNK